MSLNFYLKGTNISNQLLNLHQLNSQPRNAQGSIDQLPETIRQKIFWHIWNLAGKPSEDNYGKVHVLDNLDRLHHAIKYTAHELFDSLSEKDRKSVGGKVWYHSGSPDTEDRDWGERRAKTDPELLLQSLYECFGSKDSFVNNYLNLFGLNLEDYDLKNGDLDEGKDWSVLNTLDGADLEEIPEIVRKYRFYWDGRTPRWVKDELTNKFYFNDSPGIVRYKCFLLIFGTALYAIAVAITSAIRVIGAVSAIQLWFPNPGKSWEERVKDWKANMASLLITPIALLQMEKAALKGVFGSQPYDARKNFTSWERLIRLPGITIAPCFHPSANRHFFGGDPSRRNAF